ncbi:MAG: phosphoglycerate dehydrogenase [Bacillota bacterium]|nr:phosphoglycerate dehydrogenase [Bacillota bacterium]
MYNILALNKIAACGLEKLGSNYNISDNCENPDGIILRSFKMHDMELPDNLKAVARAGAGVNNIPIDKCTEKGIVVFNTPGANANAVKELVIAALFLTSRDIVGGVNWAKTLIGEGDNVPALVEKGKSQFGGVEVSGKTLVVIGLGAIGTMVANTAYRLGMDVVGYDPFLSIEAALHLDRHVSIAEDIEKACAKADYITIHMPLNGETKGQFNSKLFDNMKDGVRFLNFSRGELVDIESLKEALDNGKISVYITDFPNEEVIKMNHTICIPHLGASSEESEDNCAVMASRELRDYLENGNITNSVNFPNCSLARAGLPRITVTHKNVPAMISAFTTILGEAGINIENIINKSNKELAYTIIDVATAPNDAIIDKIKSLGGVLGARVL